MKTIETRQLVAVQNTCAWPNLTLLPDGTIVASIFNQPCHGMWQGALDCHASTDGGENWHFRGCAAPHEGETNRMNCAAGLDQDGNLLVLVSGWTARDVPGKPRPHSEGHTLRAWVNKSGDGGRTWVRMGTLPETGHRFAFVPFGDVTTAHDGALCVSAYDWNEEAKTRNAYLFASLDGGESWKLRTVINPGGNETAILHLGEGRWLAASRVGEDSNLNLLSSNDDGYTWENHGAITEPNEVTGHLLQLEDGRVLLSYGDRNKGRFGVKARFSDDGGKTWGEPFRIANVPAWDCGYPSSVQRADGKIVTAFYCMHPERGDYQYQMDVAIWQP